MILRYLERFATHTLRSHWDGTRVISRNNEVPKPTIALDYNYAKKPKNIDTVTSFFVTPIDQARMSFRWEKRWVIFGN